MVDGLVCSVAHSVPGVGRLPLLAAFDFGGFMRPVSRSPVNKGRSARKFRAQSQRTAGKNMQPPPQRGGYRL